MNSQASVDSQNRYDQRVNEACFENIEVSLREPQLQSSQNIFQQNQPRIIIQNIFNKDFTNNKLVNKGGMIVKTQKSKYQPYSFKKSAIGSPCVSPRDLSPPIETKRERIPGGIASLQPQEAQRKLNEIAIKQFLNLGSKDNNYGPLTRQLATGSTLDRPVKEMKSDELQKQVILTLFNNHVIFILFRWIFTSWPAC